MDYHYIAEDFTVELPIADYIARYRNAERIARYCQDCENYGQSWSCPPFNFNVTEYLTRYETALLIATKITPEMPGIPISEAKHLIRPERQRLEQQWKSGTADGRSPMSGRVFTVRKGIARAPKASPAAIRSWYGLRSKPAGSILRVRPPNCSASS